MDHLAALHRDEGRKAAFLFIYVTEVLHKEHLTGALCRHSPDASLRMRRENVRDILGNLKFPIPCAFDQEDRQVERAYNGWPQRLVVIDVNGDIAFDAGQGILTLWNMAEIRSQLVETHTRTSPRAAGPRKPTA